MAFDVVEAGKQVAQAMIRNRSIAQEYLDAATASGNRKEARQWASELRKLDKLIARYGLDRNA